ncbi:MAG: nuclear transport factor 2 family protein [Leptospira sp.]|nr:nuclear transport factor 2 family protein [Leptospira sp.]
MSNEDLIKKFYTAFQNKDSKTMADSYDDNAEFSDPVFTDLKGNQVKAMWMMLIEKGADTKITFSNVKADGDKGSADWEAVYAFGKTGRIVHNRIHAEFKFKNGKIIEHRDSFNLWKWAGMALGLNGYLLGFTPIIQNKVRKDANTGLVMYMKRKKMS